MSMILIEPGNNMLCCPEKDVTVGSSQCESCQYFGGWFSDREVVNCTKGIVPINLKPFVTELDKKIISEMGFVNGLKPVDNG